MSDQWTREEVWRFRRRHRRAAHEGRPDLTETWVGIGLVLLVVAAILLVSWGEGP